MNRLLPLGIVALAILALAMLFLVIGPAMQIAPIEPPDELEPYSKAELRGRAHYVNLGCVYCHSQQPRSSAQAPDETRGWGRASTPADYVYDRPHQLGTMRTGPDLLNIGVRQPSRDWQLTHLYAPRSLHSDSIMPAFPFLFETKSSAESGDVVVSVPDEFKPDGKVVVARQAALDLVAYLLSLDRSYPPVRRDLRDNGYRNSGGDS
ncbi:cbb3-type cytochrome c oxidase subunit II [Guyparkeria hydrothermalis]|uniref:cbb3-type cytochrome c oxidase subunit II n=1 Tax=Guyparkeria hydrothermalis TaxID=923 RepID=UPI002020C87A|nr:cbb3-type cytochrome c oxidase subunit II [Guyparkeria hydrothermalis]MCL7743754.1 cbb3-type cytochrome c oxidase subunit II [Guyparkeria hydrothermalis]